MSKRSIDKLERENRQLQDEVDHLQRRLKQADELHAEWVKTMTAMHRSALETLERVQVEQLVARGRYEALIEAPENGGVRS